MELLWCTDAGASSFWYSSNSVERRTVADDDGYQGWGEVLRTLCGSALSYLQLPTGKHSLCLDLTVFGLPVRVRMQSDAVKTAGILCIIGIGIGIGLTSWLVCKLHGPAGRSHGRAFRWGRDAPSTSDFGSRQRSRSLVSTSKSLAVSILPSELFSDGLARRRRQALESHHDVEAEARDASAETSVLIDSLDGDVTAVSGSSREARQWLRDETFVDRRVHGPIVRCGRQSQTARSSTSDVLGWGRHCQTSTSGLDLGARLSDVISSGARLGSVAEKGQMPWHSALAALSNVPSMQSSTRDSGFLEWAPGDMQQSTDDERFAAPPQLGVAAARLSCGSDATVDCKYQGSSQTRQQLNLVAPDWAWTVAENDQPTLPDTCSPFCRANTRSVEAWLTQQQQQQIQMQQTHSRSNSVTLADCVNLPPYCMHIDASTMTRKSDVAGTASASVAFVAAEVKEVLLLAEDVGSVKPMQTVLQGTRVCPDAPLCKVGERANREVICIRDRKDYAAAAPAGISPAVFSRATLETLTASSELAGGSELTDADCDRALNEAGRLLPDECSDGSLAGRQSHAADRPLSPASDWTLDSWTDDLPSFSACSSDVTSPVHSAASYSRCCRSCGGSTVASAPCPSGGLACACAAAGDNRSDSPATPSLADLDRSTPSVDGPDTVERLSAIETELSILKSEMSEIEQCLRGLIVRDSFDSIYSPERFRKLTRVVLESDHVAGLTSAEIGKAFDILRKYRPGRAATRDDFLRGSSWPDESGPLERRNSFSDSPRRSRDSALRELVCEVGVSSDDELTGRRIAADRGCLPPKCADRATPRKVSCIKSSSSLTNLAAMASPCGTVCSAVSDVRSISRSPHLQNEQCEGTCTSAKNSANEREESECRRRGAVFHGLKLIDVAAACRPNATGRHESDSVTKGLESISNQMGLSQICSVEGSIDCCALRAVLIGALLAQLPLTPKLRQAVGIFKTLSSPPLSADAISAQHLSGQRSQADCCSSADEYTVVLSLLAEADQEVKVLEECLARHAGNASRQHDVEMLSDLLLGVFNDRDRDEIVLHALEVVMTLRACRFSAADMHQPQHLNGYKSAAMFADLESTDRFWREILRGRNDKGQRRRLETIDLCTLAESLGCVLLLLRPSRYGQADFATYLPVGPKPDDGTHVDHCTETSSLPIVALVTDDDEHYSVALS